LLQVENELHLFGPKTNNEHQRYTRDGMIRRVMAERRAKADTTNYHIEWAKNIHGDHIPYQRERDEVPHFSTRFRKRNRVQR
jgi:DNA-dependent RNA polymerase auxiliary subunit epsilon